MATATPGRLLFVELKCTACHTVIGTEIRFGIAGKTANRAIRPGTATGSCLFSRLLFAKTFAIHAVSRKGNGIESRFGDLLFARLALAITPFVNSLQGGDDLLSNGLFGVLQSDLFVDGFAHIAVVFPCGSGTVEHNLDHAVNLIPRPIAHFQ